MIIGVIPFSTVILGRYRGVNRCRLISFGPKYLEEGRGCKKKEKHYQNTPSTFSLF